MTYPDEAIVFEMDNNGVVEFWDWDTIQRWIRVVHTHKRYVSPYYAAKYQLRPLTPAAQAVWEAM